MTIPFTMTDAMRRVALCAALVLAPLSRSVAQRDTIFTHADTLRGSVTSAERNWWDVTYYDLHVKVMPADSSIRGHTGISYKVVGTPTAMQIDLQEPMAVDSMIQNGAAVSYRRDGNAFFATLSAPQPVGSVQTITVYFHGQPRAARRPPWDGGYIWAHDSLGRQWIATANQGLGASVWWPNKDSQADEPDSQRVVVTMPDPMMDVSNGRLRNTTKNADGTTTYDWFVADPINNYDVSVNAAQYAQIGRAHV